MAMALEEEEGDEDENKTQYMPEFVGHCLRCHDDRPHMLNRIRAVTCSFVANAAHCHVCWSAMLNSCVVVKGPSLVIYHNMAN